MATDKYGLGNVSIGTVGWNGILDANMELIDAYLHTYISVVCGETIYAGKAVCIGSDGKARYARAGSDSDRKPTIGIAIENGLAEESIRIQRVGVYENSELSFASIGQPVYLDSTNGELTQSRPSDDIQILGIATEDDAVLLAGNIVIENYLSPSTTTTTTTTTTSV